MTVKLAHTLGEIFPLTYFLRIVRRILLKGNGVPEIILNLWLIGLFLLVAAINALNRNREFLD